MTKFQSARKAAHDAYRSKQARTAGTVLAYSAIFAAAVAVGYAVGTAVLYLLVWVFGAKIGVMLYLILYGASMAWIFITIFQKDKYGFRA